MSTNFDNKLYINAPTTMQGDLNALLNYSTATYVLAESSENMPATFARKTKWRKLLSDGEELRKLQMAGLLLVSGGLMIAIFAFLVLISIYEKNEYYLHCFLFAFALIGCICYSIKLRGINKNQFYIDISNANDEFYQFRIMPDNKLYIITGANFDENGESIGNNSVGELEPIYSDLIIMDSISALEEHTEGVVIKGQATFRSYRITGGARRYLQLEHPQQMTIFLQKGIYQEEMLHRIAQSYGMTF